MTNKKTNKKAAKKNTTRKKPAYHAGEFMGTPIFVDDRLDAVSWGFDIGVSERTAFSNMSTARRMGGPNQPTTLTSKEIDDAIQAISRGMRQRDETIIEELLRQTGAKSPTEVLELTLAIIQAYGIQLKEGPGSYGTQKRISMRLPLGRHTQNTHVMSMISPEDREHACMDRHYTYVEMFVKLLDPLAKWIDIAERAKKDMTFKEILQIENIEQRRAALNIFGEERLLEEAGARLLDTGTHSQELYVIPQDLGVFDTDAFYLKYNCPSTGRLYISGVDPALFISTRFRWRPDNFPEPPAHLRQGSWLGRDHRGWADQAMAWKFHMTPEEYATMSPTNQA